MSLFEKRAGGLDPESLTMSQGAVPSTICPGRLLLITSFKTLPLPREAALLQAPITPKLWERLPSKSCCTCGTTGINFPMPTSGACTFMLENLIGSPFFCTVKPMWLRLSQYLQNFYCISDSARWRHHTGHSFLIIMVRFESLFPFHRGAIWGSEGSGSDCS